MGFTVLPEELTAYIPVHTNKLLLAFASTVVLSFGHRQGPWPNLCSFQSRLHVCNGVFSMGGEFIFLSRHHNFPWVYPHSRSVHVREFELYGHHTRFVTIRLTAMLLVSPAQSLAPSSTGLMSHDSRGSWVMTRFCQTALGAVSTMSCFFRSDSQSYFTSGGLPPNQSWRQTPRDSGHSNFIFQLNTCC
jgi:hypothetical protein